MPARALRHRKTLFRLAGLVAAATAVAAVSTAVTSNAQAAPAHAAIHLLKPRGTSAITPAAASNLISHGGPVENAPRLYVVYWGWVSDPSGEQSYLNSFLSAIGGTSWLATVNQYGAGSQAGLLGGTWSDSSAIPSSPTDAQIQAEADKAANHFGTGTSPNVQIVVATATGHSTSGFGTSWCAYHGTVGALPNVTYTDLPYNTDSGSCGTNAVGGRLDGVSIVEGHELAEAVTDPLLNAWFDSSGAEIGDKCAWQNLTDIPTSGGTFAVQPLWSNATGGCVLSSGSGAAAGPVVSGVSSSLCLDDNSGSTTNGNKIQIWGCNGTGAQQWTVNSNGTLTVLGKCLDDTGWGTADGTLVELWDCTGGGNQVWQAGANGSLVNQYTGKCLDDPGSSTTTGTQMEIWTCNGGANQQWQLP